MRNSAAVWVLPDRVLMSSTVGRTWRRFRATNIRRLQGGGCGGGGALGVDLFDVIPWAIRTPGSDGPLRVACNFPHAVLAYTDACGDGRIGSALFTGGRAVISHSHAPHLVRTFGIAEPGPTGATLGLSLRAGYGAGANVLLSCDNLSALGVNAHSYLRARYGRALSSVFLSIATREDTRMGGIRHVRRQRG